jgi:hypothetical protein
MPATNRRARAAAVLVAAAGLAACAGGGDGEGACGPTTREALDPAYLVHVLGDADGIEYTSDPPTSGPHQPGPEVDGVADEPLPPPIQVGILERGDVLVQFDPSLDDAAVAGLEELAGSDVVVAPNPDLPAPVVATAWLFKRTCDAVDVEALTAFAAAHAGQGPED